MEERSRRREALPEVLKDRVHAVNFYLLDGLLESLGEAPYGFLFLLYYSLQRTIIHILLYGTKVVRDEYGLELPKRIY